MATATLEERVAIIEAELTELKARNNHENRGRSGIIGRTRPDFLDRFFGIHAGSKMAAEVLAEIDAEREREREEARNTPDQDDGSA